MRYPIPVSVAALLILSLAVSSEALTAREMSVVPGADIVGFIAIDKANASPMMKKRRAKASPESKQTSQAFTAKKARFEAATGLTEDDIVSLAFSCDMDTAKLAAATQRERIGAMQAIAAIQVAKPISITKIKQAIKLEYGSQDFAGVADTTFGGHAGLIIKATAPTDPDAYLSVSPDGRIQLGNHDRSTGPGQGWPGSFGALESLAHQDGPTGRLPVPDGLHRP